MSIGEMGNRSLGDPLAERVALTPERNLPRLRGAARARSRSRPTPSSTAGSRTAPAGSTRSASPPGTASSSTCATAPSSSSPGSRSPASARRMVPSNIANTAGRARARDRLHRGVPSRSPSPISASAVQRGIDAAGTDTTTIVARGRLTEFFAFDDLPGLSEEPAAAAARSRGDDVAELIFTSGTTAKPKARDAHPCQLPAGGPRHRRTASGSTRATAASRRCRSSTSTRSAMTLMAAMTVGGTAIVLEEFSASRFWDQVRATGDPDGDRRDAAADADRPAADARGRDHDAAKVFYAINVSDQEKETFEERFGVDADQRLRACRDDDAADRLAGRRAAALALDRPARARAHAAAASTKKASEVATGEVGEICVEGVPGARSCSATTRTPSRPPRRCAATCCTPATTPTPTSDGYLYFFDRKKDMIKRAGENVSAIEVESVIVDHPAGRRGGDHRRARPDPRRGGRRRDRRRRRRRADRDRGRRLLPERLSPFKVPTIVAFETELPKTSIGKVRKDELRKRSSSPASAGPALRRRGRARKTQGSEARGAHTSA